MDLQNTEAENMEPDEQGLNANEPYPVVIKPFYFVLLCITTLGVYHIWWQYKCWKYFKEKEQTDIMPALRALLFLFFGIELFNRIKIYAATQGHQAGYNPIAVWAACIALNMLGYLPVPFALAGLFAFAPMLLPVRAFNLYFTDNKNGYQDDKLNQRQITLILIGLVLWAITIAGIVLDKDLPKY